MAEQPSDKVQSAQKLLRAIHDAQQNTGKRRVTWNDTAPAERIADDEAEERKAPASPINKK